MRCKTIRKAVVAYNTAAAALNPPRPPLDWSVVSNYGFVEEFALLQDTHNDIRERQWAKPNVRATLKLRNRVARAKEELIRLNIESRRLHTAILDEDTLFTNALAAVASNPALHGALSDFATRRRNVNDHLLDRIEEIYNLDGFTGQREPGEAVRNMNTDAGFSLTVEPLLNVEERERSRPDLGSGDEGDSGDEDNARERDNVVVFISELAL